MAMILNDETYTPPVYIEDGYDPRQMDIDNSTIDTETERIYEQFAKQANGYAAKARNNRFYDFKTKNKSFINLYNDLYRLGVKNNKFFLRIYDKDLIGVDPYSSVLPKDMQLKVYLEVLINPWYFLREILRIPEDGMPIEIGGGIAYRIDRNNAACWYLFLNAIDHYQSKPRQQGKTQDAAAKFNYAYNFGTLSSTALFFNKDQDQANINLYRLKCQRDMMPSYLQMKFIITENGKVDKGIDNTKSIRNPVTGNTITTMGKATSKESAMKLGRGATAALQWMDEFDFTPYQTEIMRASAFAYSTANRNALKNSSLSIRILSSTPGDLDSRDGAEATEFVKRMLVWNDKMFDTPIEELRKIVNSPAYNRFVFVEHSWKQLKLPMEWYQMQCGLVSNDMETILREIELKRIHGSNSSPFSREAIMYISTHKKEPIKTLDLSDNLCPFCFYDKVYINKPYILSVDPSEGLGQDNNAVVLIDPITQKVVVEFETPYIAQPDLFKLLVKFMDEYCRACMIIVESNKGRELINYFLDSNYRDQLYYDDGKLDSRPIDKTDPYGRLKKAAMERRAYGWWTGNNRSGYYSILENIMEERKDIIFTSNLVDDVCGLIRQMNGKVVAGKGSHDDTVMAYLIGLFVYFNSSYEKLAQYGIIKGASDDFEDYDEAGQLTEEGALKKMLSMMDSLPPEMRELLQGTVNQRSTEMDEIANRNEIAHQAREAQIRNSSDLNQQNNQLYTNNQTLDNSNFWDNYANDTFGNNNSDQDTFNIEDYL